MLYLIGIKKNVDIKVREKFSIANKKVNSAIEILRGIFDEIVILSTCNRTEIYYNTSLDRQRAIDIIFEVLCWEQELREYIFIIEDGEVIRHLFEVVCGFHSKILGEDQILGQIRDAMEISKARNGLSGELLRLIEDSISCGKKFRNESKLYEIPVSSSSIAVNKAIGNGAKKIMVMGYGTIGSLVIKYALSSGLEEINLVVRDKSKVNDIYDNRIRVLDYDEAKPVINGVDAVISCTAAPHTVIKEEDINPLGKEILLIDLALPRDIDVNLGKYSRVLLYDIDDISKLDYDNKLLRLEKMKGKKYIIDQYVHSYSTWQDVRNLSDTIIGFKHKGNEVVQERVLSFKSKCKEDGDVKLANTLIKSTSDYYINRAIKILKEEKLNGREEECLRILKGIFMED